MSLGLFIKIKFQFSRKQLLKLEFLIDKKLNFDFQYNPHFKYECIIIIYRCKITCLTHTEKKLFN